MPDIFDQVEKEDIFDKVAPAKPKGERSWLDLGKDVLAGPYKGQKPEDMPGFFRTLYEGPKNALTMLAEGLMPPKSPEEAHKTRSPLEAFQVLNLYPPIALANALSARAGKTAYELSGSPEVAGATDIITNLAAPWGMTRLQKFAKPAQAAKLAAMPKEAEIERTLEGVAKPTKTVEEFGLEYKGPKVPQKGEAPGYYREAEKAYKGEASSRYQRPFILAEDTPVDTKAVSGSLKEFLDESGLAVKIAPTRAETFAKRVQGVVDPIAEEQDAFQTVKNMTAQELQGGLSNRATVNDIYKYIFKMSKYESTAPSEIQKAQRAQKQIASLDLPKDMTLQELLTIRQRLNGARRAVAGNDAVAHQFGQMKNKIDAVIEKTSPKVREALREADTWYVSEFLPAFGRKEGALRKLTQHDAGLIVDELVPKGSKFEIAEKHIRKLSSEAQESLRSAWVNNLMKESRDLATGEIKPGNLQKTYSDYSERTKWALLGGKKPQMDDLMKTIAQATKDSAKRKIGHGMQYAGSGIAAIQTIFALKDVIEYQFTGNKRLLAYAGADLVRAGVAISVTRPEVLARVLATKQGGINAIKSLIRLPANDPNLAATAMNVMELLKVADQELQQERGSPENQNSAQR